MLPCPVPYEYCTRIHGPSYEFRHQDTTYQRLLGCTIRSRHLQLHIYLVSFIYVVLFPCFGNIQQDQPRYFYVSEETTPYTSAKYQARLYRMWCPDILLSILYDLLYPATPHA